VGNFNEQVWGGLRERRHWLAKRAQTPPITIPTGNKVLGLKTATGILTTLEEVFERDGSNEQRQG